VRFIKSNLKLFFKLYYLFSQKIPQKVKIDVLATKNLNQITYHVIGKGDIIVSETITIPGERSFQFEFMPTMAMVPKASVVVFYITDDGEIISDSLKIEFGNELRNFIDIELSKDQAKPGETLEICVSSSPNSFVGLLGVDQSVLLLKKGNDIEQSTVFAELEKYNEVNIHNYHYAFHDTFYKDFESSGTVIITNANKKHGEKEIINVHKNISTNFFFL
jgi:CD109 antigen